LAGGARPLFGAYSTATMAQASRRYRGLGLLLFAVSCVTLCIPSLAAQGPSGASSDYRSLARDIFKELIEIKSTESGVGSTPAAEAAARRLRAAGFPERDIQIGGPAPQKKNVVVRLRVRASDFYAGVEFYDQFVKSLVGQ
jgi:hypothetical protein